MQASHHLIPSNDPLGGQTQTTLLIIPSRVALDVLLMRQYDRMSPTNDVKLFSARQTAFIRSFGEKQISGIGFAESRGGDANELFLGQSSC